MNNKKTRRLYVDISKINVDYETNGGYQRDINIKRCEKIASNFNEIMMKNPKIAERDDGSLWVIDGNHTLNVLKIKCIDRVWCDVFKSTGREEEAPLFVKLNSAGNERGKNCTPYEIYKAGISCNDKNYIAIRDLMDSVEVSISDGRISTKHKIICLGTLFDCIKKQPDTLRRAVNFIKKVWPDDNNAWNADIIVGVMRFLSSSDAENNIKAIRNLKKNSCGSITNKASVIAKATDTHRRNCVKQVLLSIAKI